ncbi:hypothetical protein [Ferruginibacter profundus]
MNISRTIFFSFLSMITGIALCMLFTCNDNNKDVRVIQPAELEKKAEQSEQNFQKATDSLTKRTKSLHAELLSTNFLLDKSKKKNALITSQLVKLSGNDSAKKDTTQFIKDCDSLRNNLKLWVESSTEKDSLFEAVINNQQSQLVLKDAATDLQNQRYNNLNDLFRQSLLQQELLSGINKKMKRSLRRQQFKTKMVSGLLVIAAGITAHYLVK